MGHDCVELFFGRARGQDVAVFVMNGQAGENPRYLRRRFALAENHLGHALPQDPMVVYFGEAQVFEGEMAQSSHGFVGGEFAGAHFLEEAGEGGGIHVMDIVSRSAGETLLQKSEVRLQS